MALNIDDELNLPLSEFVKLPTTVDFQFLNTERFKIFAKSRPYIRLGTEFENGYIVGYINQAYVTQLLNDLGGDFLYFCLESCHLQIVRVMMHPELRGFLTSHF